VALATLAERYAGLLSLEESGFIEHFGRLPEPTQCLVARLAMRKGPHFRRATLRYAEIPDLEAALQGLVALGWLDSDPRLSAQDLMQVLNGEELRLAVGFHRPRAPSPALPTVRHPQLALPLDEQPVVHRSLSDWNAQLAGAVVHLCVDPLIRRLQLLFFGNDHQSWEQFVLVDLGVNRYEPVALHEGARAFHSRDEIEHYYRLQDCRARLDAGEPAGAVREHAAALHSMSGWLGCRFMQLHVRIGERLEAEGKPDEALRSYREGGGLEGMVRAVRLQTRLGRHAQAQRDALAVRQHACSEAQREAIERALSRRKRRPPPEGLEVIGLEVPQGRPRQRIEIAAAERLTQPGAPVFYVENSLLTSLFGLWCWEALFAPVPGAFFHPFQSGPADLHTPEFRARREPQFSRLLDLLGAGPHEPLIWQRYRAKAGIRTHFVHWNKLRPPLLRLALGCIPAAHLKVCFERLLEDLRENAAGLPDLVQFWPTQRRYRLIEVKGAGDRLQDNQRRWFRFFARHGIPAAVCQARWAGADRRPAA